MQYEEVKKLCNELKVDFNQLFILKSISDKAEDDYDNIIKLTNRLDIHKHNIEVLCNKKYVQIMFQNNQYSFIDVVKEQIPVGFENLKLTELTNSVFTPVEKIESFCERMYEKFPKGVKIMNRYSVRSGLSAFEKKLERFIKEHPRISLTTIEMAFDLYINRANLVKWEGCTTAEYVIYRKEGSSERSFLESCCEEAKDLKKEDIVNIISGQTNLFNTLI